VTAVELPDTAAPRPVTVTEPGVYDMPDDAYHADPVPGGSLSSTGARRLLPPSCPALFAYERENGQPHREEWDLGKAAHKKVLGVGEEVVIIDAPDWRTKAARDARDQAYAEGKVPLLPPDAEVVEAMAAALQEHPFAGALLAGPGQPEASLFWVDPETRINCRARLDWLPDPMEGRRLIVPDYKTCRSAAPDELQRAIYTYGYHQQGAWYRGAVRALGIDGDPQFVLIAQEKTPPYLVTVAQPDPSAMRIGAHLNREALRVYRECTESGRWPGYTDDVAMISLPGWVERQYEMELSQ